MDQYDSISNKLHDTKSFHDNRDVSTTYLGPGQQNRTDEFQPELSIPMNVNSHTEGRVLGGNRIDMLLDTGASKWSCKLCESILPPFTIFIGTNL